MKGYSIPREVNPPNPRHEISRRNVISSLALLPMTLAVLLRTGSEGAAQAVSEFSFLVYGDSRPMMYLPFRSDRRRRRSNC
jgi:hypothetical protein